MRCIKPNGLPLYQQSPRYNSEHFPTSQSQTGPQVIRSRMSLASKHKFCCASDFMGYFHACNAAAAVLRLPLRHSATESFKKKKILVHDDRINHPSCHSHHLHIFSQRIPANKQTQHVLAETNKQKKKPSRHWLILIKEV